MKTTAAGRSSDEVRAVVINDGQYMGFMNNFSDGAMRQSGEGSCGFHGTI